MRRMPPSEDEIRERLAWVKGLGPRFVSATAGAEGCIAYDGEAVITASWLNR